MNRARQAACIVLLAIVGLAASAAVAAQARPDVAYPDGYRRWVHIKSGWIGEGSPAFPHFGGMHHIYANPKAMAGYRTGTFPRARCWSSTCWPPRPGPAAWTPSSAGSAM